MMLSLVAALALAQQPKCPFDAKVRALADGGAPLEAVAKQLRALPEVKRWVADDGKTCKRVDQLVSVVRVLDGLSQRCTSAFVELHLERIDCRDRFTRVGSPNPRFYAVISADPKGALVPTWSGFAEAFPLPRAATAARVECAGRLDVRDAGTGASLPIVRDPTLRFDGCTLLGLDESAVRREVEGCLVRSDTTDVTVRFYEADAGRPRCAVTTTWLADERVEVVRSGGFIRGGPWVDSTPRFDPVTAYLQSTDAGTTWLCNDLSLENAAAACAPLEVPATAREGCRPPAASQPLLAEVARRTCNELTVARRDVALTPESPDAGAGRLHLARLSVEQGDGVLNESELIDALRAMLATTLRACSNPEPWQGVIGSFVVSPEGSVLAVSLGDPKLLDACHPGEPNPLRRFRARMPRDASVSVYRFALEVR